MDYNVNKLMYTVLTMNLYKWNTYLHEKTFLDEQTPETHLSEIYCKKLIQIFICLSIE